jgi:hypothetical protein
LLQIGHVESAQISIFIHILDKKFKIALVVFSVPYNTSVRSDLVFDEVDGTVTITFYTAVLYKNTSSNPSYPGFNAHREEER